jgi:hemerythrin superfamily protein
METKTTSTASEQALLGATDILREDHRRVKALFREYEAAARGDRRQVAEQALRELELHSLVEEKFFYPEVRKIVGEEAILQAREAHALVDELVAELCSMPAGRRFDAKFSLLIDNVLAHVQEEESFMLPAVESSRLDLTALGRDMTAFKYRAIGLQALREGGRRRGLGVVAAALLAGLAVAGYAILVPSSRR